jgi:hypothetical protein
MTEIFGPNPAAARNIYDTLQEIVEVVFIIVVGIACLIFLNKLYIIIKSRKRMGF